MIYEVRLEDLFRAVLISLVRGNGAREGGNKVSLHVTLLLAWMELGIGTLVLPGVLVSTHPRGEGLGRRDLVFIGASVGLSEGIKEGGFDDVV